MNSRIATTAAVLATSILVPIGALGSSPASAARRTYPLGHAHHCRVHYVKRTLRHRVRGKVRRYVGCVSKGDPRAHIDPDYTQNPSNPLDVTFNYSASDPGTTLPNGVLNFFVGTTATAQTLGCEMNVGGSVTGGTCEIVFAAYGPEIVTVQYLSGTQSATQTTTENIQDPNSSPSGSSGTLAIAPVGNSGTSTTTTVASGGGGGGITVSSPTTTTTTTTTTTVPLPFLSVSSFSVIDDGHGGALMTLTASWYGGQVGIGPVNNGGSSVNNGTYWCPLSGPISATNQQITCDAGESLTAAQANPIGLDVISRTPMLAAPIVETYSGGIWS